MTSCDPHNPSDCDLVVTRVASAFCPWPMPVLTETNYGSYTELFLLDRVSRWLDAHGIVARAFTYTLDPNRPIDGFPWMDIITFDTPANALLFKVAFAEDLA